MIRQQEKTARLGACIAGVVLFGAVLLTPTAANASSTFVTGSLTCLLPPAPWVHITSTAKGTITHYHRKTGGAYQAVGYVNGSWTTRVSSKNYASESATFVQLEDGGSISDWGIFCDN